uniref:Uncharacterized protein n=1 Tax=Caenorhabditis japonica TaxID=281687 RepID=A0A8R1IW01_CAEJA
MSDVTQTHSPRNETITVDAGEDEDEDGEDTEYENEDEDEDEELGSEEATEASVGVYPEVVHPESTIEAIGNYGRIITRRTI